jgi:hypothetical protein
LENAARDLGQRGKDKDYGNGAIDVCKAFERVTNKTKLCG